MIAARASSVPAAARKRQFERAELAGAGAYRCRAAESGGERRAAATLRAGRRLEVDRRVRPVAHGVRLLRRGPHAVLSESDAHSSDSLKDSLKLLLVELFLERVRRVARVR